MISEDSPYKRRPTQKRTWMTVPEMGKLLGLKKTDRYWLVHKNVLNQKRLPERYKSILPALKNGTPIRLNTIKLPEKNPGKNCNPGPIPLRKSRICWVLMIILFMNYSRKIKWKRLLSITGNEYQKNLFRTGIKASPGIGQRKTEKRTLFWKMQLLRCRRWHSY